MPAFIKSDKYKIGENGQRTFERNCLVTAVNSTENALAATNLILPTTMTLDGIVVPRTERSAASIADSTGATRAYEVSGIYESESEFSVSFIALNMESAAAPIDIWRANANAPANLNAPNDDDIGGTVVDQGGYPISFLVPQQTLTVVNIETTNMASSILNAMGKRNNATFAGGAAGYVLFAGASAIRKGSTAYEITYKLVWDSFAHCRQQPTRDLDGKVKLSSAAGTSLPSASKVLWRQPFPSTANFAFIKVA